MVVVVTAGAFVVVVTAKPAVVVVVVGAVVVGVVGVTKGTVSPASVAADAVGAASKLVHERAVTHACCAVVAGVPVSGSGRPSTMVAGRKVAEVMCRPTAVRISEPLSVSGAVLS